MLTGIRLACWAVTAVAFVAMLVSANTRGRRFWLFGAVTILAVAVAGNRDLAQDAAHSILRR
ncbi:MAG: hypothetical protein ACTHNU_00220 [Gaiellales bacterium]